MAEDATAEWIERWIENNSEKHAKWLRKQRVSQQPRNRYGHFMRVRRR